ncbi:MULTISPECIES: phosphoadenylyl-sulfate reductase [Geobacter]|uniref:phosphoadenylyl-sulfate reductase n=1 Tax=Geobacter TaxID=28231 RepID=UPI002572A36B|nr:phosphoadenylyl-sulfate reductase [Geobacter sulfurreducens]BEH10298.1 phosphoadenylyl-sulfate reductase [Geobacter sulfurreducens subsp. ethanolicus]BET58117.1 phosphoadenylyl-sulfate reductase [Geobacter sp. 60473]
MATEKLSSPPRLPGNATPLEILRIGIEAADGVVSLACSFSVEDVIIIDLITSHDLPVGIFAIDTGRLPEETHEVAEAIVSRYGVGIDWYFPRNDEVERLLREKGPFSFRESLANRHQCCHIRKVEPLERALAGLAGWVTGVRRAHGVTRANLAPLEIDGTNGGIVKINPLLDWTDAQVWEYAEARQLPVNRLHHQGYPSIGCAPCTRAVTPGQPPRSGRWWWEDPEHKECGLHRR